MQWAVNNFLVSIFVYYQKDNFETRENSGQHTPLIINAFSGAMQTFSIL